MPENLTDRTTAAPIRLVEETLRVDTRQVETGRVRVRTVVDEEPVVVNATLSSNYVTVDRIAIDRVVDAVPPPREVDGVMIISIVEERLRVVRELVLIERCTCAMSAPPSFSSRPSPAASCAR